MKKSLGVVVVCGLLAIAGCGGVAELDSGEVETVDSAKAVVAASVAKGSLQAGGMETLTEFMILCRDKPLAEEGGDSLREIMDQLAPQLEGVDATAFRKMDRLATNGCD